MNVDSRPLAQVYSGNPCLDVHPSKAGWIPGSNGGRVAAIDPVEWLGEGVCRVTVESGRHFMIRPRISFEAYACQSYDGKQELYAGFTTLNPLTCVTAG